jgi:hypothetical protein
MLGGACFVAIWVGQSRGLTWGAVIFLVSAPVAAIVAGVGLIARHRRRRLEGAVSDYDSLMANIAALPDPD